MGQQAEGVGITFKVGDVIPESGRYLLLQFLAGTFSKERLDGLFARMSKGRIAQVVGQTSGGYNLSNLFKQRATQFRTALVDDALRHIVTQRHAYACHLQRVCQSVVYEDAARQREYLCLVL